MCIRDRPYSTEKTGWSHPMRGADEASQPRFGRDGEAKLIPFLYVARWATTGGRCGVLGSRRVKPRREPQQARQVAASGGGRRAKARSVPRSPHACRTLRESTRARRYSVARRVFVEVGNRRHCRAAAALFPTVRRSAPVDASRHATRPVSHLRRSKPYAKR